MSTEQEYDAQADIIDEDSTSPSEPPHSANAGSSNFSQYLSQPGAGQHQMGARYGMPQQPIIPPGQPPPPLQQQHESGAGIAVGPAFGAVNQLFDPFDPMLDSDPFGLSASMHFPTQYQYEQQQQRPQQ